MKPVLVSSSLLLLSFAACGTPPASEAPPRAVRVRAVELRAGGAAARYAGTLEPEAQVDLAFRVPGRVALVGTAEGAGRLLQEGDAVQAGQVLAALDLADLRRQDRAADAAVATAAAQVQAGRTGVAQAEREVARARRIFENGDLAQADLDRAEAAVATARANLDAAEAQHRARVEQQALTHAAVADATLRSPLAGVVARRGVDPGESVGPNVPVFSVIGVSSLKLVFGVPDTRVNALKVGQRVPVRVEALPERSFEGTVSKIAPTADPALRTYAVELLLTNAAELRPGMTATALLGDAGARALSVPLASLVRRVDRTLAVYVLGADGKTVEAQVVEVEDLLENDVLLRAGLDAGARVVVEGAPFLREGERVEVVP